MNITFKDLIQHCGLIEAGAIPQPLPFTVDLNCDGQRCYAIYYGSSDGSDIDTPTVAMYLTPKLEPYEIAMAARLLKMEPIDLSRVDIEPIQWTDVNSSPVFGRVNGEARYKIHLGNGLTFPVDFISSSGYFRSNEMGEYPSLLEAQIACDEHQREMWLSMVMGGKK